MAAAAHAIAYPFEGGCDCGQVKYAMKTGPIIVHCCHCRWCQRETGASFALNAMIEADQLVVLRGEPEWTKVPSESGAGQNIARCPTCKIALYSVYYANPAIAKLIRFVRVGTLDTPELLPPNAHIWTSEKQPWVVLSDKVPAFEVGYELEDIWPAERYAKLLKDHNVPAELSPEFP